MGDDCSDSSASEDVILVHGARAEGDGYDVLRLRNDRVEAGVVRPLKEGRAIVGELVALRQRPESPSVFDVETPLYDVTAKATPETAPSPTKKGPAQVASRRYRENWQDIFRPRRTTRRIYN